MKYLLGIDFGGGSSKATLMSTDGNVVAESSAEYPTYYETVGAAEQEPSEWIAALKENVACLVEKSQIDTRDILCMAIDSATHTSVVCDENYKPIRRAMHWTDSRSTAEVKYLKENYGDRIFELSFHRPDTIWTLPQLMWLKANEPENFGKIRHIFFEKDYIRYYLTDVFCTDYIEAQGSMLFDCRKNEWSKELLCICGIDLNALPPVKNPTDIIGSVTAKAAKETGLYEGTPVICGTTDTCMEVFASGAVEKGDVTVKLATAGRICVITDKAYPSKHLVNYAHIADGMWYPGTATKAAASSYRWFRDTFGGTYGELDSLTKNIPIGSEGLIYHPYINGELTPYADPMLCGSFTGIRATHTKGHFAKAVMEGVSLSLLDCKQALDGIGIEYNNTATLIGGGAKGKKWAQITADVLGITLKITENSDSSFGSCMLAGIAAGVFSDAKDAAKKCVKPLDTVCPNAENTEKYKKLFLEYKKIHDALAPIYDAR